MSKARSLLSASLLALTVGGCVVGPNYQGPPAVAPAAVSAGAFHRADAATPATPPPARWWTQLNDPELDHLVDAAFAASPDLEAAVARLRQSRAGLRQSQAQLMPSTGASALYLRAQGLSNALGGGSSSSSSSSSQSGQGGSQGSSSDNTLQFYDVGFDATWEIDLFGGQRRAIEGARAQSQAAEDKLQDAQVSLAAEVAQAYVTLRDLQQRLALSRQSVEIESRMLDLTRERRAGGTASDLDIEQLNNQLQSTRADAVPLQAQIAEQLDRLAVLTGRAPGELDDELSAPAATPLPPAVVAVGDPADLLRRRPDVRAAEQTLIQKNALIGQRTADLFPKVELLGTVGYGSSDISQLFQPGSFTNVIAPVLQWKPFDFGRTQASIQEAKGERAEAMADYRQTVLGALQDAEIALSRFGRQRESVVSLEAVQASADRAAQLTQVRVEGGTADTLSELDAERQRVSAESGLSQAKAQLTQDYIGLQKSLGLGWGAVDGDARP